MFKKIIFMSLLSGCLFANNTVHSLNQKILNQEERIDGLISLLEGLSIEVHELKQRKAPKAIDNTRLITDLANMIDDINSKYVSKDDLNKILKREPNKKVNLNKLSNKKLYSKAVKLFYKQKYVSAISLFEKLVNNKYKLGSSNYFLGESYYYSKDYENAIHHYKKSVSFNQEAKYTSLLLYHAAYSLERTNQKDQAKIFYQNIVDTYNGKYAILSKKRLSQLK